MAILTSLVSSFRRPYPQNNPALAQSGPSYDDLFRSRTVTGLNITESEALTIPAVFRSLLVIASSIAAMPLDVFEDQKDEHGDTQKVKVEYDEDDYLWYKPNPEMHIMPFWEMCFGDLLLAGNIYLWITQSQAGTPLYIWRLEPWRVIPHRNAAGEKVYILDGDAQKVHRDYTNGGEILHIMAFSRDGLRGVQPIEKMAQSLGLSKSAETFAALMFGQGATLAGLLSTDSDLTPVQAKAYSDMWESAHGGLGKAHRTAVVGGGLKWQNTATDPEKSQMLGTRQFQVAEVGREFGAPEFLIGSHDKQSSWGSGLQINMEAFKTLNLQTHIIRAEQAISVDLLNKRQTKRYVKWNANGLLRGSASERAAYYQIMYFIGALSLNDILALEDRPGIGPLGDRRLAPLNMTFLDLLEQAHVTSAVVATAPPG